VIDDRLRRLLWLSIGAAIVTIALKTTAWLLTGSIGLLSDAAESLVNLVAAVVAMLALRWSAKPADEDHAYGHAKVEYFSAGVEGALISVAAVSIAVAAVMRLLDPQEIEMIGAGVAVAAAAGAVNLGVGLALVRAGRESRSVTVEANGRHLLTDVTTSVGVIAAVIAVAITGWDRLDPIIALVVAANIVATGVELLRRSFGGLMDRALCDEDLAEVAAVLDEFRAEGIGFHALRTRESGSRRFVSTHILVPGRWSVQEGHDLAERVEHAIRERLPQTTVFTHIEPAEDPRSFDDTTLDRVEPDPGAG